jgi:hypothetical protein
MGNLFAKHYKLHYQPKTVETPEGNWIAQYGCLNFHAKRDGSLKLNLTIKNMWSTGWTKSWFYYHAPGHGALEVAKSCIPSIHR